MRPLHIGDQQPSGKWIAIKLWARQWPGCTGMSVRNSVLAHEHLHAEHSKWAAALSEVLDPLLTILNEAQPAVQASTHRSLPIEPCSAIRSADTRCLGSSNRCCYCPSGRRSRNRWSVRGNAGRAPTRRRVSPTLACRSHRGWGAAAAVPPDLTAARPRPRSAKRATTEPSRVRKPASALGSSLSQGDCWAARMALSLASARCDAGRAANRAA